MVYKDKNRIILYAIRSLGLWEICNKIKWIMPPSLGGDLKRLRLTIGFMVMQFKALAGITVIQVFVEVFGAAVLSTFLCSYLKNTVETIIAAHKIIMIPFENLLLQWCAIRHPDFVVLP